MNIKKITAALLALIMLLTFTACSGGNEEKENAGNTEASQSSARDNPALSDKAENDGGQTAETPGGDVSEPEGNKILVAYFSATNNTEGVAQKLAHGLGADLYEITPAQPYTDEDLNYNNSQSRSSAEMNNPNARPAISGSVKNMEQYGTVFIGYPIWWGEAPRIMSTFIESYDFSGKTLVGFCTSGSSGFGNSDSALRSAASGAKWLDGQRFSAGASADDVLAWANGLGIK